MGKIANLRKKKNETVKKEPSKKTNIRTYEEIRFRFILGETLVSLSAEYNVPLPTLKQKSSTECWGLQKKITGEEDKREFRRALIDKNYNYIDIYTKIRKKAEGMLKNANTPKDLNLLTQVVKTVHEQELLCFALRGGDDEEN